MIKQNWMILTLCLVFGLPFLAITDLFPFHRFGMFAQKPQQNNDIEIYHLEVKTGQKTWESLKTGNAYMDESYLPQLAQKCMHNSDFKKDFGAKIYASLKDKPDSVQVNISGSNTPRNFILFPL